MVKRRQALAVAVIGVVVGALGSASTWAEERPVITVGDLRGLPDGGLVAQEILFFFHDGRFDLFDFGEPAGPALAAYAGEGDWAPLLDAALDEGHAVWRLRLIPDSFNGPWYPEFSSPLLLPPPPPDTLPPSIDPSAMPFVSFAIRFDPGDDLFYANEDPKRYRLFGEAGEALRLADIDLFGADLLDAGVRENDELDLRLVDGFDPPASASENGVVRPHPGFAGAARQGDDVLPGRLLTVPLDGCVDSGCPLFDPARLDFTEPGTPLLRLSIGAPATHLDGTLSGSYYDPARSGEGFSIDFVDGDPDRLLLYWYSYAADGSGEPLWLVGQGTKAGSGSVSFDPFRYPDYELDLYTTTGGRAASPDNPELVQLVPWGTARLGLLPEDRLIATPVPPVECERLRLYAIEPFDGAVLLDLPPNTTNSDDPPIAGQEYAMERLGPPLTGQAAPDCRLLGIEPESTP